MKIIFPLLTCCFLACHTYGPSAKQEDPTEMLDQEATVEAHVITRGRFQYVIVVPAGPHTGKYLPEEEPAAEFCQDGLQVIIDAKILEKKGTVYKPGPTDIPEKDFDLPVIQITAIAKQ